MTDILTTQPLFNPFFVEDRQIKKIVFYNDSGVVFETRSGWFGNNNNFRDGFNIPDATLRRKVDFTRKECFYTSTQGEYYERNRKFAILYLYIDGEKIKQLDKSEYKTQMSDSQVWYYERFEFDILGQYINEHVVKKIEKTDFGRQVEEMEKKLEEMHIKINSYDLTLLMKKFDLVEK